LRLSWGRTPPKTLSRQLSEIAKPQGKLTLMVGGDAESSHETNTECGARTTSRSAQHRRQTRYSGLRGLTMRDRHPAFEAE
jgi:hypothetical protein